jgi:hypothetical protein
VEGKKEWFLYGEKCLLPSKGAGNKRSDREFNRAKGLSVVVGYLGLKIDTQC